MTTVNLLPWREERRRQRAQRFYGILGAAFVFAGLVVGAAHLVLDTHLNAQELRNQYLRDEITRVEREIEEIQRLEEEKERLLARMDVIQTLQQDRAFAVQVMAQLAEAVPEGVQLDSVSFDANRIQLRGRAQSNARVSAFMRELDATEVMTDPSLGGIDSDSGTRTYDFTLNVQPHRPDLHEVDS